MIIQSTNILAAPLLILLWAVDVYLFVVGLRLLLGQLSVTRNGRFCQALQEIVDPLAQRLNQKLFAWRDRPTPRWLPWASVIVGCLVARHLLLLIAVSVS
jgi:hypothetical protein